MIIFHANNNFPTPCSVATLTARCARTALLCVCVCVCVTTAQGDTRLAPKTIHEKDDCSKPVSLQFLAGNNNTNNTNNNNKYHQELLAGPGCLAFPADLPCPGHPEVRGSQGSQEDRARVRRL